MSSSPANRKPFSLQQPPKGAVAKLAFSILGVSETVQPCLARRPHRALDRLDIGRADQSRRARRIGQRRDNPKPPPRPPLCCRVLLERESLCSSTVERHFRFLVAHDRSAALLSCARSPPFHTTNAATARERASNPSSVSAIMILSPPSRHGFTEASSRKAVHRSSGTSRIFVI